MPMSPYPVLCTTPKCSNPAVYKIASRWSDGIVSELKTYSLCCGGCLREAFRTSRQKQAACRLTQGESLDPPGIYQIQHGTRDQKLQRLPELEREPPI